MVLAGVLITLLGFAISVCSLVFQSTGARLAIVVFGLTVSLIGILGVLNKAYLRNANWKRG